MNTLALNAQQQPHSSSVGSSAVAQNSTVDDTADTTTTSSTDSSPVDTFLTLFVAEIQNQDPTDRPTPPNISTSFRRWRRWR